MIILQAGEQGRLAPLFKGAQATPVWSCLQGYMGEAAADDAVSPRCARILLGDFCYPAGDSGTAEAAELIGSLPPRPLLAIPPDGEWARLIERVWTGRCRRIERYAIKKEPDVFRHSRLERLVEALPGEYRLRPIDETVYPVVLQERWSRDFCSNFDSCEDFCRRGLGVAAFCGSELVGGASSYSVYRGGLEVEVDTKETHRRRGIAAACAAKLLLECRKRGWYASWDAANWASVRLAEKLGYHFDAPYPAYEINHLP
ncbi:MAG TPA: GNAT family N-acetyltransferase [Firmicutes bacterium]|nr:GNAT family N-acetyltransferase [Bacillota bacterium]